MLRQDEVFNLLAANKLSVDFININPDKIVFNLNREESRLAQKLLEAQKIEAQVVPDCAKVSIVGAGIMGTPGVTAKIVAALSKQKIQILQTTDSYTTIWVLVNGKDLVAAVNALHDTS